MIGIAERIALLQEIQVAVRYAFTNRLGEEQTGVTQTQTLEPPAKPRRSTWRRSTRRQLVSSKEQMLQILRDSGHPLTPAEVYQGLMTRRWRSKSHNPRGMVGVYLAGLARRGELRKTEDGAYSLVA